jgi:hypothetical protein
VYVPETLDVTVDYGEMDLKYRPEDVAPVLLLAGRLDWGEHDASLVTARGSPVNTTKEESGQTTLFIVGIVVAAFISFVPQTVLWTIGSAKLSWSRFRR